MLWVFKVVLDDFFLVILQLALPASQVLTHDKAYRRILTWLLRPMEYQMETAAQMAASMGRYVGLHIRGEKTNIFDELPLEAYMRCVDTHFGPDIKVYLASPNESIKTAAFKKYGERVVTRLGLQQNYLEGEQRHLAVAQLPLQRGFEGRWKLVSKIMGF